MRHASTQPMRRENWIARAISGFAYLAPAKTGAADLPSRRDRQPVSCTGGVAAG